MKTASSCGGAALLVVVVLCLTSTRYGVTEPSHEASASSCSLPSLEFYVDIITKRKQNPDGDHHYDMIASLLDQKYRSGDKLRDHEVAHIMIALLMAGQHTSSATLSWTMLHLASRPDIADALYDEQVKRFGNPDGTMRPMSYEDLRHLPLLDSCVRETLRIHPPIHSIMRKVREDVVVPATLAAPSKDSVYVVPKDMDYTDEHGEKIDHGFGAVSKGTDSPYQPFGAGKHRCIGEQSPTQPHLRGWGILVAVQQAES
ncbi:cytochrome P450 [Mycena vitilis]|nr:cytochrome P450 [Mycena vitilis]